MVLLYYMPKYLIGISIMRSTSDTYGNDVRNILTSYLDFCRKPMYTGSLLMPAGRLPLSLLHNPRSLINTIAGTASCAGASAPLSGVLDEQQQVLLEMQLHRHHTTPCQVNQAVTHQSSLCMTAAQVVSW
jgi:hypothetical protein